MQDPQNHFLPMHEGNHRTTRDFLDEWHFHKVYLQNEIAWNLLFEIDHRQPHHVSLHVWPQFGYFPLHAGTYANNSLFMLIECLATNTNQCFVHFAVIWISVPIVFHKCFTSANCVGDPFPRYEISSKIFCLLECNGHIRSTNLPFSESWSFKAIFFAKTAVTKP